MTRGPKGDTVNSSIDGLKTTWHRSIRLMTDLDDNYSLPTLVFSFTRRLFSQGRCAESSGSTRIRIIPESRPPIMTPCQKYGDRPVVLLTVSPRPVNCTSLQHGSLTIL